MQGRKEDKEKDRGDWRQQSEGRKRMEQACKGSRKNIILRQEAGRGPGNEAKQFANCILLYNFYYETLAICSYPRSPQ